MLTTIGLEAFAIESALNNAVSDSVVSGEPTSTLDAIADRNASHRTSLRLLGCFVRNTSKRANTISRLAANSC